jgi:hypothetical protein
VHEDDLVPPRPCREEVEHGHAPRLVRPPAADAGALERCDDVSGVDRPAELLPLLELVEHAANGLACAKVET